MPPQCSRCNQFISKEEVVKLDLEEFHQECAIEEILEEVPDIPDYKKDDLRERVRKADELMMTRNGLEVIQ